MSNSIFISDLYHCPHYDTYGGIATRLWYAYAEDLGKFIIPTPQNHAESRTIGIEEITLKLWKKLRYIDVYLDQNSLTEKQKGNPRKWKDTTELNFTLLGMSDRNLSFKTSVANAPVIFFVLDNNSTLWVVGTPKNPAYLTNSEAHSGQKIDDDSRVSLSFSANTKLHKYAGKIEDIAQKGAFTKGFTKGFRR